MCRSRCYGINLANPAAAIPEQKVATGASYHLGGYTLTNKEILPFLTACMQECTMPREFPHRCGSGAMRSMWNDMYSREIRFPCSMENSGSQEEPSQVSTPVSQRTLIIVGIGQATYFYLNKYDASYRALMGPGDRTSVPYPRFGYITAGPLLYLIQ